MARYQHTDEAPASPIQREVRGALKARGIAYVITTGIRTVAGYVVHKLFRRNAVFVFNGKTYRHMVHLYNRTWENERAVELPIIWDMVQHVYARGGRVLEVGNVLGSYFLTRHEIVDKYERASRVLNQDILDFRPAQTYDLIVSISTLEHIGFDEQPQEPEKVLRAVDHLRTLLAPGGVFVATIPIGANPHLDRFIDSGALRFDTLHALRRAPGVDWYQDTWEGVRGLRYGSPFRHATAVVIASFTRGNGDQAR